MNHEIKRHKEKEGFINNRIDLLFGRTERATKVFKDVKKCIHMNPSESHFLIGARWYQFSAIMPKVLATMLTRISDPSQLCRIARILYEELGEGNPTNVHYQLYLDGLIDSGINPADIFDFASKDGLKELDELWRYIARADEPKILGVAMGLELIAQENIEHLALAFSNGGSNTVLLNASPFFKIHFQNEIEHIAANLQNYDNLHSHEDKMKFSSGLDASLDFWNSFWQNSVKLISSWDRVQ